MDGAAEYPVGMRPWLLSLALFAALPVWADVQFRVAQSSRTNIPPGKGQCDIRLQIDNEAEVSVRGDTVSIHTITGQDGRNDGDTECNIPLPLADVKNFQFQAMDSHGDMRIMQKPAKINRYTALIYIRDSNPGFGRYYFRLSWDLPAAGGEISRGQEELRHVDRPTNSDGFAWNNTINFRGKGAGETRRNEATLALHDVTVDIDRGAKILVSFDGDRKTKVIFSGTLIAREGALLKADVISDDRRLRGVMVMSVDDRQNVNSISLDATDGQDHLKLNWGRR